MTLRTWLISGLLLVGPSTLAADRESLCTEDEQIAFSCHIGAKVASLCASKDLSGKRGWAQYRFGQVGRIELAYPQSKQHPRVFMRHGVIPISNGGTDYYRFTNHGYTYVVYSGIAPGWEKEGVVVEKGGRRISSLVCRDSALGHDNWAVMYSADVPMDAAGDYEFSVP
jgi:hypothetical protein